MALMKAIHGNRFIPITEKNATVTTTVNAAPSRSHRTIMINAISITP